MKYFDTIGSKIKMWLSNEHSSLNIFGFELNQWSFFLDEFCHHEALPDCAENQIIVCPDLDTAETFYALLKNNFDNFEILFFPGLEVSPYRGMLPAESNLYKQFYALSNIVHSKNSKKIVVTTVEALLLKIPGPQFIIDNSFELIVSDIISPYELAEKLVEKGYSSATTIEEPGTFSKKGEIFDIYPVSGKPVRLHYFDDMIEEIFEVDPASNKTVRESKFEKILISPSPHIFIQNKFANTLRSNIPMPGTQHKEKFEKRKQIFSNLSSGHLFDDYPFFISLFIENSVSLTDYFNHNSSLITFLEENKGIQNSFEHLEDLRASFDETSEDKESDCIVPAPDRLYFSSVNDVIHKRKVVNVNNVDLAPAFDNSIANRIEINLEPAKTFINRHVNPSLPKPEYLKEVLLFIDRHFKYKGHIIFSSKSNVARDEFKHLLDITGLEGSLGRKISFENNNIEQGFYYDTEQLLVLSEGDLFTVKKAKAKEVVHHDLDLFAEQLATLKENDYVIHTEHGLGQYLGLESLDVGNAVKTDYMVILYSGNDKVYVPVYKMNLIQKHADSNAELSLNSLRSNKFSNLKDRAKNSIKKLAFDLLKLQAERESSKAYAFSPPDHYYKEFELAFPFQETADQKRAIEEVIEDMQSTRPMDHLVCGDVGFGKTEVAMRAAFKAVEDQKQVAVLVPTTILALQHYNSFKERFKNFPVHIEFLSRFKSPKESNEIKEKAQKGEIDILIGTHKLLASSMKFSDLGLVIVDEEQRFGVNHKEKLKLLKASVDFLTLTATPIPRTLQLAFLGLRDLSLIQTAPPKRQSIKSYIIKEDPATIQNAIVKELGRGGQVFIVHNRVNDMELYKQSIEELVPNAKIIVAHGQMPERELEKRMKAFYSGDYQILISTTIIESGLDIPNANTMIIDRADTYGLSQLHQLRGRIGRSDRKAYAYFVIPKNRSLSDIAEQRLKALQTYADMGSGFNIASCDLEIRGAGDILGAQQSGHIEAIGLELYMELLKEAIEELKGEKRIIHTDIEITTPFPSYIPNTYIEDSSERLRQYKKLSNCKDLEKLQTLKETLVDVYGMMASEMQNLFTILECRAYLKNTGLKSISVGGNQINLKFDKQLLESDTELRNRIVETFISRPKIYQFTPEFTVICSFKSEVDQDTLLNFSKEIAQQILPS